MPININTSPPRGLGKLKTLLLCSTDRAAEEAKAKSLPKVAKPNCRVC